MKNFLIKSATTIEDLQLKIENTLTIRGIVSILGYLGKFVFTLAPMSLQLEIHLPKLHFSDGLVKIVSSCDCSNIQKFDGPTVVTDLAAKRVKVTMNGVVKCLGMSKAVNISINDSGFEFKISGSLYGVFESEFKVTAGFGKPSEMSFMVSSRTFLNVLFHGKCEVLKKSVHF